MTVGSRGTHLIALKAAQSADPDAFKLGRQSRPGESCAGGAASTRPALWHYNKLSAGRPKQSLDSRLETEKNLWNFGIRLRSAEAEAGGRSSEHVTHGTWPRGKA